MSLIIALGVSAGFDEGRTCILRYAIPALAAFAALTASPAVRAADMPRSPPPAAEPCCNWYLRGFVGEGMTNKFRR